MECSVCYADCSSMCRLTCGHTFCTGCIKTWYLKGSSASGANSSCPMCRRPIYFKGFHKVRDQWDEDSYDTKCGEVLGQAIDECFEEAQEMIEYFGPKFRRQIMGDIMNDIRDIERTYNFLKSRDVDSGDIEYILLETEDYFSDRHKDKCEWLDEPPKELATRYPHLKTGAPSSSTRHRALKDLFEIVTVYLLF